MLYLKIFKAPKDYSYYISWRAWHQEKAIFVTLGAADYALGRWIF